ncbi:MerR family transcriptional regulator [Nocardia colli]|uniref:MerR family transcriptional regulator n=1 Tax=Nocardia colli TaxID=2545717 RepID=UPI0035D902F9
MDNRQHSITAVARAFGLRMSALRYYEHRGLVQPAVRRARVRYYDHSGLRRLALLLLWHRDGMFTLDDTAALMETPDRSRWTETLHARIEDLAQQIDRLSTAKRMLEHFADCTHPDPASCPVLADLLEQRIDQAFNGFPDGTSR